MIAVIKIKEITLIGNRIYPKRNISYAVKVA